MKTFYALLHGTLGSRLVDSSIMKKFKKGVYIITLTDAGKSLSSDDATNFTYILSQEGQTAVKALVNYLILKPDQDRLILPRTEDIYETVLKRRIQQGLPLDLPSIIQEINEMEDYEQNPIYSDELIDIIDMFPEMKIFDKDNPPYDIHFSTGKLQVLESRPLDGYSETGIVQEMFTSTELGINSPSDMKIPLGIYFVQNPEEPMHSDDFYEPNTKNPLSIMEDDTKLGYLNNIIPFTTSILQNEDSYKTQIRLSHILMYLSQYFSDQPVVVVVASCKSGKVMEREVDVDTGLLEAMSRARFSFNRRSRRPLSSPRRKRQTGRRSKSSGNKRASRRIR
jgi:hypothetical protein